MRLAVFSSKPYDREFLSRHAAGRGHSSPFPNVIVTGRPAFFTREALDAIARTTLENVDEVARTCTSSRPSCSGNG